MVPPFKWSGLHYAAIVKPCDEVGECLGLIIRQLNDLCEGFLETSIQRFVEEGRATAYKFYVDIERDVVGADVDADGSACQDATVTLACCGITAQQCLLKSECWRHDYAYSSTTKLD